MYRITWPLVGLLLGAAAGCAWGWFGANGYEGIDSAAGTGLMGALAGLLVGAVAAHRGQKRRR